VTSMVSPASTLRRYSLAFWRSSLIPILVIVLLIAHQAKELNTFPFMPPRPVSRSRGLTPVRKTRGQGTSDLVQSQDGLCLAGLTLRV